MESVVGRPERSHATPNGVNGNAARNDGGKAPRRELALSPKDEAHWLDVPVTTVDELETAYEELRATTSIRSTQSAHVLTDHAFPTTAGRRLPCCVACSNA